MHIILFLIAIIASTVGAISGIGGGIIIKPVLDSLGIMSLSTINFLSNCTVLSMALSSFIRNYKDNYQSSYQSTIYLTIGACVGGTIGKMIFSSLTGYVGMIQSIFLLLINIIVLLYCCNKHRIKTLDVTNSWLCVLIGLGLGGVSSFLGIGGGPINIAVLSYFFSTLPKITSINSLFIILFSQFFTLVTTVVTNTIPIFSITSLLLMCIGGVLGAIIGSRISAKLDNKKMEIFFMVLLVFLIALNIYNVYWTFKL